MASVTYSKVWISSLCSSTHTSLLVELLLELRLGRLIDPFDRDGGHARPADCFSISAPPPAGSPPPAGLPTREPPPWPIFGLLLLLRPACPLRSARHHHRGLLAPRRLSRHEAERAADRRCRVSVVVSPCRRRLLVLVLALGLLLWENKNDGAVVKPPTAGRERPRKTTDAALILVRSMCAPIPREEVRVLSLAQGSSSGKQGFFYKIPGFQA